MVLVNCKFFAQGYCRFGDSCRFYHGARPQSHGYAHTYSPPQTDEEIPDSEMRDFIGSGTPGPTHSAQNSQYRGVSSPSAFTFNPAAPPFGHQRQQPQQSRLTASASAGSTSVTGNRGGAMPPKPQSHQNQQQQSKVQPPLVPSFTSFTFTPPPPPLTQKLEKSSLFSSYSSVRVPMSPFNFLPSLPLDIDDHTRPPIDVQRVQQLEPELQRQQQQGEESPHSTVLFPEMTLPTGYDTTYTEDPNEDPGFDELFGSDEFTQHPPFFPPPKRFV